MSKRVSRRWTHMAMISIAVAVGTVAGYLAGLAFTLYGAERSLRAEVHERLYRSERFPDEGRDLLDRMNGLPYPRCSEAELTSFRRFVMNARYVKEVGRMRGARLACSASLSRDALPETVYEPAFRDVDGVLIYTKIKSLNMGPFTPIVMRKGDAYIALDPYDRDNMPSSVRFTLTMRNAPVESNHLGGSESPISGDALIKKGYGHTGGSLYATECSLRYPPCVTATLPVRQALLERRRQIAAWTAGGCALGVWAGFVWVAFFRLRRGLEHQLRRAVRRDALRVVYQPLVDMTTRSVVGAEALVRWTDEDKVAIPPDMFIKIAEERGFVNRITELVVRRVLTDFGRHLEANPEFRINVNVAASDLTDPGFQRMLENHLWHAHVSPRSLGIELTEGATARHEEAIKAIAHLRHRGHKVYIDDFGTGYSSLAYLKDLAVDGIKVDRAFTRAIGTDSVTVGILPQILAMAEVLKLSVVAEGVETEAQNAYYADSPRPITGQGWLYGFPVTVGEFRQRWLGGAAESNDGTELVSKPQNKGRRNPFTGTRAPKTEALSGSGA